MKRIITYIQYILPQRLITLILGKIAATQRVSVKNKIIERFIKRYNVDMTLAIIKDPTLYPTFNDFFTRQLKPEFRPMLAQQNQVACPVDGVIAEIGRINKNQLLQAKGSYFNLENLLGGDQQLASRFIDGNFATFYLSPKDYHRIHMPLDGKLVQTIFIPGRLFSVNRMTTDIIPNLYARNERYVCIFETELGRMAVILVGAMIVGSMQVKWVDSPIKSRQILSQSYDATSKIPFLAKGDELGFFKLGSTVIVIFENNKIEWSKNLHHGVEVKYGQILANFMKETLN
jgi:phosphatidylserine decarboxylase